MLWQEACPGHGGSRDVSCACFDEVARNRLQEALGGVVDFGRRAIVQDHSELGAGETGYHVVAAQSCLDQLTAFAQDLVSAGEAVDIVDQIEALKRNDHEDRCGALDRI